MVWKEYWMRNNVLMISFVLFRAGAGANGIFSRRLDFSTFNLLPKHKVNSYQIKVSLLCFFVNEALSGLTPALYCYE